MDSDQAAELARQPLPVRLTAQFYAWERWGRGWDVWPHAVALEPPFRPFHHWAPIIARDVRDDGRKATLWSAFFDAVSGRGADDGSGAAQALWEEELTAVPEPVPLERDEDPAELHIVLPVSARAGREGTEQLLLALATRPLPVSFEVIGTAEALSVQLACAREDARHVAEQLRTHLPDAVVRERDGFLARQWRDAGENGDQLIADFGLSEEFMLPLETASRGGDPLASVIGSLAALGEGEVGVFQVMFAPTLAPWKTSIMRAVTDAQGGSFFDNAPDMPKLAAEKTSRQLFSAVLRIAVKSPHAGRPWDLARQMARALRQFERPGGNALLPLENDGYPEECHEGDLLRRESHRSGMLVSLAELACLAHIPSAGVRHPKLVHEERRTKAAPAATQGHALVLGTNEHHGVARTVSLPPELRLRHMHVIGSSGTGKSTFLLNLITQDLEQGNGVAVLDPHGDLIDQVVARVPEHRIDDVIVIDPSDGEYPVGFNILKAHSEVEKTLLSSDLVAAFRRLSTSWGDQMTSVLGNAVMAFLESSQGGTLSDLRRFLVEKEFRAQFLTTVQDPEVVYFWQKEFTLLKGTPQAPLLTRLDTFLRPKLVRNIVSQKDNKLDLAAVMNEGKVLLVKLAQGAIGEENAALLGTLFVAKLHQTAIARQQLPEKDRRPFILFIDEFHHFITPSVASILSGARKYGLGLVLAHQELQQLLRDKDVSSAVLSNAATRVCFRLGDSDAERLAEGFASFEAADLTNLDVGQAICRVERSQQDFNLRTRPLPSIEATVAEQWREEIVCRTRQRYAVPRSSLMPTIVQAQETSEPSPPIPKPERAPRKPPSPAAPPEPMAPPPVTLPAAPSPGRGGAQHKYLQELIRRWGVDNGYRATVEKSVLDGLGSVDVALERDGREIACEICVTTDVQHEAENAQKCLAAGFERVFIVAADLRTRQKIQQAIHAQLGAEQAAKVVVLGTAELFELLKREDRPAPETPVVRGYKVKVSYEAANPAERDDRKRRLAGVILDSLKKMK